MTLNRQNEVDKNYEQFLRELPDLMRNQRDRYALMKDQKILGFYTTSADAAQAARTFIHDGIFSIQHVTDMKIDLGFYNHAVPVN